VGDLMRFVAALAEALCEAGIFACGLLGQRLPGFLRLKGFGIEERLFQPLAH
jgi:hypothetical protein